MSADNIINPTHPFDYLNDFLSLARSGAAWLESVAREDKDGIYWEYEPENHEPGGHSIFSGDGGVALTFLQLWQHTKEQHYLDIAVAQARSLVHRWEHGTLTPELPHTGLSGLEKIPGGEWSYYEGAGGPAYVILEVGRNAGDQDLIDAGFDILDAIVRHGRHTDGVYWANQPGILFDGGIIVLLAWATTVFGKDDYRDVIDEGAQHILTQAVKHEKGLSWRGLVLDPTHPDAEWPGFEFGTAGVGYLLARAYQITGKQAYLNAALEGEQYLQSISVPVGDGALVPYTTLRNDVFYLGNCHGPAGTSRLAQILLDITGDQQHADWRTSLYRGLKATGAPQTHSIGYWNTDTLCCGTAAITHFGINLWTATQDDEYLQFALNSAQHLAGDAFLEKEHAVWKEAFVRVDPTYVSARTSYLAGNAGIIAILLEAERAKNHQTPTLRLPEDPYPPTWH